MHSPSILLVPIGLLGLLIGSFLNVVIYRVPRDESVLFPSSHCTTCKEPVKAWHNVPVIGWLVLHGRCASCQTPISVRYPLVEGGTAVLFVAIAVRFGISPQLPAYLYLAAVGVTLAMIDFDVRRLPDSIVLPSYVVSVLLLMPAGAVTGEWWVAVRALLGGAALWAMYFMLLMAYPRGLGFGDVKLAGLLGLYLGYLGWGALLIGGFGAFVIGGLTGTALIATGHATRQTAMPFAPSMITAAVLSLFVAVPITTWYGSVLHLS